MVQSSLGDLFRLQDGVIGKFIDGSADTAARAEEAFRRALELNPRLSVAHKFYAHLEAETGQPRAALVRLLGEANRHGNDPANWLERRPAKMLAGVSALGALKIMEDPEAVFQIGWLLCDVGEHEQGLDHVRRAVGKGYSVAPTLSGSRAFDAMRSDPAFQELLAQAEAGRQQALPRSTKAGENGSSAAD
jgi:hypothetical protein